MSGLAERLEALRSRATDAPWQSKNEYSTDDFVTLIGNVDGEYIDGREHCTYDTVARFEDEFGERQLNVAANIMLVTTLVNNLPAIIAALKATSKETGHE